jgi:hypothetical protein
MSRANLDEPGCFVLLIIGIFALIIACVIAWKWYACSIQQDVYARQHIVMSKWEIFMGAKPATAVQP